MVNFENGVTPINDTNLNKAQQDIINGMTTQRKGNRVGDSETGVFDIDPNATYLIINSHAYQRCMLFVTTFTEKPSVDVIFKSGDNAVPEVSQNGNQLTIKAKSQARLYLFKINGLSSS